MDEQQQQQAEKVPVAVDRGGKWVALSGKQYKIPPLNFKALRELGPRIASLREIGGIPTDEQVKTITILVHAAIVRNYPSITVDEVEDMFDVGNYQDVLAAVMNIAGFVKAADPGKV